MSARDYGEPQERSDSLGGTGIGARVRAATWSPVEPTFGRLLTAILMAMAAAGLMLGVAFLAVSEVRTGSPWLLLAVPVAVLRPGRA